MASHFSFCFRWNNFLSELREMLWQTHHKVFKRFPLAWPKIVVHQLFIGHVFANQPLQPFSVSKLPIRTVTPPSPLARVPVRVGPLARVPVRVVHFPVAKSSPGAAWLSASAMGFGIDNIAAAPFASLVSSVALLTNDRSSATTPRRRL